MHRNKFYEQHDGVSMGSFLGPTIANSFLVHMEHKLLNSNLNFRAKSIAFAASMTFLLFLIMIRLAQNFWTF